MKFLTHKTVHILVLVSGLLLTSSCGRLGYKPVAQDQSRPMQVFLEAVRAHDSLTYSWCALTLNGQLRTEEADKLQQYLRSMGTFLEAITANGRGLQKPQLETDLMDSFVAEREDANELLDNADIGTLAPVDIAKVRENWHLLPKEFVNRCGTKIGVQPVGLDETFPDSAGAHGMARETRRALEHFNTVSAKELRHEMYHWRATYVGDQQ